MTALLVIAAILIVAAFVAGIIIGSKVRTTGAPTPMSAQVDTAAAEDAARAQAQSAAQKVMELPNTDVEKRVEQLRARGRSGE
jgi:hypothetical protein